HAPLRGLCAPEVNQVIPYQNGGKYIRPIALFQAQPKGKEDATTFEKLRAELMNTGIPAEHIAIRTADVNELKNVELLSPDCPVWYIITVNVLIEGWVWLFANIMSSLDINNSIWAVLAVYGP